MKKVLKKRTAFLSALISLLVLGCSVSGSDGDASSVTAPVSNPQSIVTGTSSVGEEQEDGSWLILDWNASDYAFTESDSSADVSGTFGDVAVLSGKSKKNAGYIQLSKNGSESKGVKFLVPLNTSKIIVTAKVGSSDKTSANAVITSSEADWKKSFSVSYQKEDSNGVLKNAEKDYEFTPLFTKTIDDEGSELNSKTIIIYNSDSEASLNIIAVKVYAPTEWIKETTKTVTSKSTDTGDKYNDSDESSSVNLDDTSAETSNVAVQITEAEGWLETAYIKFSPLSNAKSYTVKVDGVKIDDALIRTYPGYIRADAIGLSAGEHTMTVSANLEDGTVSAESSATMKVLAHERTGFAFTGSIVPGAYNKDGRLKDGAIIVYVTNDTFDSVVLTVNKNNKGETIELTGVQEIVGTSGYWKYAEFNNNAPLVIRILGKIDTNGFPSSSWGSSEEGLQIKGSGKVDTVLTLEGVGDDATLHGFGILCRNSRYVELRNFAVMCCKDDSISLDTDNLYTWVHNLDLFYGNAGSDGDQAKGDGTIDVKGDSKYQTYSYNHFWDNGKSSLCGMKDETGPNYISYHHNWFDHSDSRHPRVRSMSVHVYNNYFDGNAKYGIGAAMDSSIFAEGNFFRNAHDPMLSSKQGTDATGDGTFSGENGGIIKAYNNKFTECNTNGVKFQFITNEDTDDNDFDAYIVSSREQTLPSSVKTVSGGKSYDNFDTSVNLGVTAAEIDSPDTAKAKTVAYSGRHNPDFKWTFDNTKADASYAIDKDLKAAVVAYEGKLVSVQGNIASSSSSGEETPTVTFEPKTIMVENTVDTLGLVAVSVKSGSESVATASRDEGCIKITSVAKGSATITCADSDGNAATLTVTVAADGSLTNTIKKAVVIDVSALTAIEEKTYNLVSGNLFEKQEAGILQTKSGIMVTCKIDGNGANVKQDSSSGAIYFRTEKSYMLSFETGSNAAAVFAVSKNGSESGTALVNKSGSVSLEIAAGMYKIVGSASSAAKISSLTFVENNFISQTVTIANTDSELGLIASNVTNSSNTIASAEITDEGIVITSNAAGSATITCTNAEGNAATISVTVSGSGKITTVVSKYSEAEEGGNVGSSFCSFTKDGASDSAFTVAGSIATDKGSYTIGSIPYSACVKLDSGGSVSFTTAKELTLTVYMKVKKTSEIQVSIDGTKYTLIGGSTVASSSSATTEQYYYTTTIAAGSHTIAKGKGETYLFAIALSE
ncbi:MAG: hypothetical protein J6N81_00265 [Treponema sp.]|nr:hypothetical protein [Treponema sp.]